MAQRSLLARRWLRALVSHSLLSAVSVSILVVFPCFFRSGFLSTIRSLIAFSPWLCLAFFEISQAAFTYSRYLIASPHPISSIKNEVGSCNTQTSRFTASVESYSKLSKPTSVAGRQFALFTLFFVSCVICGATGVCSLYLLQRSLVSSTTKSLNRPHRTIEMMHQSNIGRPRSILLDLLDCFVFGLFFGAYYALTHLSRGRHLLRFPALQRPAFFRLKSSLPSMCSRSLSHAATASLLFIPLIAFPLTVAFHPPHQSWFAIWMRPLQPLRLLLHCYLAAGLVLCWELGVTVTEISLTQRHHFLSTADIITLTPTSAASLSISPSSLSAPLLTLLNSLALPSIQSQTLSTLKAPSLSSQPSLQNAFAPSDVSSLDPHTLASSFPSLTNLPPPSQLLHSLALLDLCLVAELRADTWRRLALFESLEVYLAAIRPCLAVVNSLTVRIAIHHRRISQLALARWQAARKKEGSDDADIASGFLAANGVADGGAKSEVGWPASGFNPPASGDLRFRSAGAMYGRPGSAAGTRSNGYADNRSPFHGTPQFMVRSEPSAVWRGSGRGMTEGSLSILLKWLSERRGGEEKGRQELGYLLADIQACEFAARAASSLTAHSHTEDRMGVAQTSGANAAVLSSLLSCLLALDSLLLPPGPWPAGPSMDGQDESGDPALSAASAALALTAGEGGGKHLGSRSVVAASQCVCRDVLAMRDVVQTCLYRIVGEFGREIGRVSVGVGSRWGGERDFIAFVVEEMWMPRDVKPAFGSRVHLVTRLEQLIKYRD